MARYLETRKPPMIIAVFGVLLLAVLSGIAFGEPQVVTDIKNGNNRLECMFSDGWRDIPKDKFVGMSDRGAWLFTNGSARTCRVY